MTEFGQKDYKPKSLTHPQCDVCDEPLTIHHILTECIKYHNTRMKHLPGNTIEEILKTNDINIIRFLKETNLYKEI